MAGTPEGIMHQAAAELWAGHCADDGSYPEGAMAAVTLALRRVWPELTSEGARQVATGGLRLVRATVSPPKPA